MMDDLTTEDLNFIAESLEYTRLKFENYTGYPSYEFKRQRLNDVSVLLTKIRALRQKLNQVNKNENA